MEPLLSHFGKINFEFGEGLMLDGWKKEFGVALETRSQSPLLFFCFLRFLFIPTAFVLS